MFCRASSSRSHRSFTSPIFVFAKTTTPGVSAPGVVASWLWRGQIRVTFAARGPLGLCTISNCTLSPSVRLRKPSARISEWWTNTSGPPSRDKKPKPLESLNHLTVPSIMNLQASLAFCLVPRHLRVHERRGSHHGCPHPETPDNGNYCEPEATTFLARFQSQISCEGPA